MTNVVAGSDNNVGSDTVKFETDAASTREKWRVHNVRGLTLPSDLNLFLAVESTASATVVVTVQVIVAEKKTTHVLLAAVCAVFEVAVDALAVIAVVFGAVFGAVPVAVLDDVIRVVDRCVQAAGNESDYQNSDCVPGSSALCVCSVLVFFLAQSTRIRAAAARHCKHLLSWCIDRPITSCSSIVEVVLVSRRRSIPCTVCLNAWCIVNNSTLQTVCCERNIFLSC